MEHIQAHDLSKKWTTYRPINRLKRGSVYKTINKLKTLNLARKAGYAAALSLFCAYIVDLKQT